MKRVEDYSSRNGTPQGQRPQMDPRTYRPDEMHAAYQRRQQQEYYQRQYQDYQKPNMPQYGYIPRSHQKNKLLIPLVIASALAVLFLFFWIFNVGHKSENSGLQNTVPAVNAVNSEQSASVESSKPSGSVRISGEKVTYIGLGDKLEFNYSEMAITKLQLIEANNGEPAIKLTYDWTNTGEQERAPIAGFTVLSMQGQDELKMTAYTDEINVDPGQKYLSKGETAHDAEYLIYLKDLERPVAIGFCESVTILSERSDQYYLLKIEDVNELK